MVLGLGGFFVLGLIPQSYKNHYNPNP